MTKDERIQKLVEAGVFKKKDDGRGSSGHRGVNWDKGHGKWRVRFSKIHLGLFSDLDEAVAVAKKAREVLCKK